MGAKEAFLDGSLGMVSCGKVVLRLNAGGGLPSERLVLWPVVTVIRLWYTKAQVGDMSRMRIVKVLEGVALMLEEEEECLGSCHFEGQRMRRGELSRKKHQYTGSGFVQVSIRFFFSCHSFRSAVFGATETLCSHYGEVTLSSSNSSSE